MPEFIHRFLKPGEGAQRTAGLRRILNPAQPVTFAPLGEPAPWEALSARPMSGIFRDEQLGRYRMWYRAEIDERGSGATESGIDTTERLSGKPRTFACYAESDDGIQWQRPELGRFEFQGSKANNIVEEIGAQDSVYWNVVRDAEDPDPRRRFKAFGFARSPGAGGDAGSWTIGNHVSFSADGLDWSAPRCVADTADVTDCNLLLRHRDPADGCWRAFVRPRCGPKRRFIGLSRSRDFETWTLPEMMLAPGADDCYDTEFYGLAAERVDGRYLGALWVMHNNPDYCPMFNELAVSADGNRFERVMPGSLLIPPGAPGAPDEGGNWVYAIAARETDLLLYAHTCTGGHGNNRLDPTTDCGHTNHGEVRHGFGVYALPRDRIAGYRADISGELWTDWVTVYGRLELRVAADIEKGGRIRVDVLDCYDRVAPGYGMMQSQLEACPDGRWTVRWSGAEGAAGEDVLPGTGHHRGPANPGHAIRFRFYLRKATLYGYGAVPVQASHT